MSLPGAWRVVRNTRLTQVRVAKGAATRERHIGPQPLVLMSAMASLPRRAAQVMGSLRRAGRVRVAEIGSCRSVMLRKALPWARGAGALRPLSTKTGSKVSTGRDDAKEVESVGQILRGVFSGALAKPPAASKSATEGHESKPKAGAADIKKFLSLALDERWNIGVATGAVLASSSISLVFPTAIGQVLDVALDPAAGQTPSGIALALCALFGVQSALIILRSALLSVSGERIAARLRERVFGRMLHQDVPWFDRHRVGQLSNTLSSDISKMQSCLTSQVTTALRSSVMTGASAGMLFAISPSLAAVSMALVPPTIVSAVLFGRYTKRKQAQVQEDLGKTLAVAEEVLGGMRVVRQFAAEEREVARYRSAVWQAFSHARSVGIASAILDGTVHMAANFAIIAVLWHGGNLVLEGGLSAGQLTSFLMYSLYVGFNAGNLSTVYTEFMKGVGASAKVFDILERQPPVALTGGATSLPPPRKQGALGTQRVSRQNSIGIHFQDVSFAYDGRDEQAVLSRLSMRVEPGEHAALVGPSGSGKSTIGALLTRLYEPSAGSITANGVDIRTLDPSWWRRQVGVVQQEAPLFSGTVLQNLRYGAPDATLQQVQDAARAAQVHAFLQDLPRGYDTEVGSRGMQLSGGQRQRLCIARMMLMDPALVLLDEATSAQDAATEGDVHEALEEFLHGRTVLSIAHRLSTIQAADSVRMLLGGTVVEEGTFSQLVQRPGGAFKALVEKQLASGNMDAVVDG